MRNKTPRQNVSRQCPLDLHCLAAATKALFRSAGALHGVHASDSQLIYLSGDEWASVNTAFHRALVDRSVPLPMPSIARFT